MMEHVLIMEFIFLLLFLPLNPLVIVVAIKKLNFFKGFWAREIADDGRMHKKK